MAESFEEREPARLSAAVVTSVPSGGKTSHNSTREATEVPPSEQPAISPSAVPHSSEQVVGEEARLTVALPCEQKAPSGQPTLANEPVAEGTDDTTTKQLPKSASKTAVTSAASLGDQQKLGVAAPSESAAVTVEATSAPGNQLSEQCADDSAEDPVSSKSTKGMSKVPTDNSRNDLGDVPKGKYGKTYPTVKEEPETNRAVDWDYTTGLPVIQFNFILQTALPWKQVASYNVERRQQLESMIAEKFGTSALYEGMLAGSAALGFHLPSFQEASRNEDAGRKQTLAHDDYDVLMVLKDALVSTSVEEAITTPVVAVIEKDESYPGYVKLKVDKDSTVQPSFVVTRVGTGCPIFAMSKDGTGYISHAAMLRDVKEQHPGSDTSRVLIALRCTSWPAEAKGWANRKREAGWPEESIIAAAIDTPCYVVGEAHQRCTEKEIQWRMCYPEAEQVVAKSMNSIQKQCYVLLKLMEIYHLDRPRAFKSSHWRALLYWACERLPLSEWTDYNLSTYFVGLLDNVIHNLVREELCDYFMPDCNMLENTEEGFLHDISSKIIELRRQPLKHLYAFNMSFRFPFSPTSETWQKIFSPIHEDIEQQGLHRVAGFLQAQIRASEILIQAFAREKNLDMLLEVARNAAKVYGALGGTYTSLEVVESVAVRQPLDISIYLYEYILKEQPTFRAARSNLGCMYHAKIFECHNDAEKEKLRAAADDMFRAAISQGASGAAMVDYGLFLCNMKRVQDAVEILERVIRMELDEPKSCNAYGENEASTVDENLRNEIRNTKERHIVVVAVCYAAYLLVTCYVDLEKPQEAAQAVKQLEVICSRLSPRHQPISYALLAYAFLTLQDPDRAHSTFLKVASLQPGNNLAAENVKTCQALKVSLNKV